jgi:alpha-beta hydrolase superfamily lysophospholipase
MCVDLRFENGRGQTLAGTVHRPRGAPLGSVVICHGLLSHRKSPKHDMLARGLASRGLVALRFDFAGRGESQGRTEDITFEGQIQDLGAAVSVARAAASPVALVGSSMGGAVAILHAARDPSMCCVVGISTVGRPGSVLESLVRETPEDVWRDAGAIDLAGHRLGTELLRSARRTNVVEAARELSCPLLLVHGERDEVVPLRDAEELARAASHARLEVIAAGDHVLHRQEDMDALARLAVPFVVEQVTSANA